MVSTKTIKHSINSQFYGAVYAETRKEAYDYYLNLVENVMMFALMMIQTEKQQQAHQAVYLATLDKMLDSDILMSSHGKYFLLPSKYFYALYGKYMRLEMLRQHTEHNTLMATIQGVAHSTGKYELIQIFQNYSKPLNVLSMLTPL